MTREHARFFAATVDLEGERQTSAATQIEEALKINPNSPDAHAVRAAMFWLQNKNAEFDNEVKTTLAINPRYGTLYEVLGHFATADQFITKDVVDGFERAMKQVNKPYTVHWYDAGHAFANPTGDNFRKEPAQLAWRRSLDFLKKNMG